MLYDQLNQTLGISNARHHFCVILTPNIIATLKGVNNENWTWPFYTWKVKNHYFAYDLIINSNFSV